VHGWQAMLEGCHHQQQQQQGRLVGAAGVLLALPLPLQQAARCSLGWLVAAQQWCVAATQSWRQLVVVAVVAVVVG
jgi:hypothetical protein